MMNKYNLKLPLKKINNFSFICHSEGLNVPKNLFRILRFLFATLRVSAQNDKKGVRKVKKNKFFMLAILGIKNS